MEIAPTDDFLVVACDGLWDVMSDDDVLGFVRSSYEDQDQVEADDNAAAHLAEQLVEEAIRRGTRDNVTCIVAIL